MRHSDRARTNPTCRQTDQTVIPLLALGAALDFYMLSSGEKRPTSPSTSGRRAAPVWPSTIPRHSTSSSHHHSRANGTSSVQWRNAPAPGGRVSAVRRRPACGSQGVCRTALSLPTCLAVRRSRLRLAHRVRTTSGAV